MLMNQREIRYKRHNKTCVWNYVNSLVLGDPGDLLVDSHGRLFRLRDTNSLDGLLLVCQITSPWPNALAEIREDGVKPSVNHWPSKRNKKTIQQRMSLHTREVWWVETFTKKETKC